jgi:nucleoside-diphosphate-sugar epimerase
MAKHSAAVPNIDTYDKEMEQMKIFITGATGVLGRHVVPQLVQSGQQVLGLARSDGKSELLRSFGAEPVCVDLFDPAALTQAVEGCDAILHLATKIPSTMNLGKRSAWVETDHLRGIGTRTVVNAALAQQVQTVIYPSICFAYPESGAQWIDATLDQLVVGEYYATTFDAEREVRRFTTAGGKGIVLRMGLFYGPESPQSWDQLRFARWGIASVGGRAGAYHPFVVIEDAARAIVAALEHAPAGTYDIVEDEPPTTAELNAAMANAVGRHHLRSLPDVLVQMMTGREIMAVMSRSQRVSNRRFKDATGWSPRFSTTGGAWDRVAQAMAARHSAHTTSQQS